jgi:hypothetical protein
MGVVETRRDARGVDVKAEFPGKTSSDLKSGEMIGWESAAGWCDGGGSGGGGSVFAGEFGGAAEVPEEASGADDCGEHEEDEEHAEAGFHGKSEAEGEGDAKRLDLWLSKFDAGGEGTVGVITEGEGGAGLDEAEFGVVGEEVLDLFLVFGGFDGAGGVDDAAAGFEADDGVFEDLALGGDECGDVGGLEAPAEVDAAAHDAGVGAWDIEEDAVEGSVPCGGGGVVPIVDGDFGGAGVEALEVFAKAREAFFVGVGADESAAAAEGCGDEEGFAAGSGAGVEDEFAGFWGEEFDGVAGGGVLDVDGA